MAARPRIAGFRVYILLIFLALAGLAVIGHFVAQPAAGAELGQRSLQLSDNVVSDTSNYQLTFALATAGTLGSIQIQFCSNDALPDDPCTVPAGFSDSAAVLASQTGEAGFSISPASTANNLILTRTPAAAPAAERLKYLFTGVTNPDTAGSYFVRLQTYASVDASGPATDEGGIAFAIVNGAVALNAEVPPYLLFCTGVTINDLNCATAEGDFIDFGELSSASARSGSSQMLVGTNAGNGYTITVDGTTMTSGVNIIPALATNDVSRPGTAQFGLNLRANTAPAVGRDPTGPGTSVPLAAYNQPDFYRFDAGDALVSTPTSDNLREFTASYIVNVPEDQAPGIYVATLTYIALATF